MDWPSTLAAKRREPLARAHVRFRREAPKGGVLHCFVLDCSGSMMSGQQLALAKGLLVAMFDQASTARAETALVCFGGARADVRFGPAVPRWWNERWLQPVGGGGGTPLALGVSRAAHVLERAARGKPAQQRWLWLLSDGRSSDLPVRPAFADQVVCVDFERGAVRLGRCEQIARAWNALCCTPEDLIAS
ncbi:MAG: magnesium chelatase [Paraburkholderia sp.]|uniref:vWA domain-containing protein n=1 Tax=Paraburkholderia sp. TaxID=1926495 RepID=UPI0012017ECE|nr:magnesium chelatase [Paraburkholderia sp.]TAL93906.1 MAG: magnesium chelatase [Paraburkholderia sp.]